MRPSSCGIGRDRKSPHCIVDAAGRLDRLLRQRRLAVSMARVAGSGRRCSGTPARSRRRALGGESERHVLLHGCAARLPRGRPNARARACADARQRCGPPVARRRHRAGSRPTTQAPQRLVWREIEPIPAAPLGAIDPLASLVLFTSGSTGVPKEVGRRVRNLEAELTALETLWGEGLRGCRVFSTVSHRHVYGLLFRVLWPLLERRPFATFDFEYPEQLLGDAGAGNALVSSPALLKRVGHLPPASGQWRAIFSSGGVLAGDAVTDATRVLGVCPTQILGSTETSGVGWRSQAPGFRALPGVEARIRSTTCSRCARSFQARTAGCRSAIAFVSTTTAASSCSAAPITWPRSRTSASR